MKLTSNVIRYGADVPLPEPLLLRAGPLSMKFQEGELRHIELSGHEIINRIYVAVRSPDWQTFPSVTKLLQCETSESSFRLNFEQICKQGQMSFFWSGTVSGRVDGTICFAMDGRAQSTFFKNRIGLCVLHSTKAFAGRSCKIERTDGIVEESAFPVNIAAHQPFLNVRSISYQIAERGEAKIRFEGETFETEDQRNWTDSTFKTYCTPLALPYPVEIKKDSCVSQSMTVSVKLRKGTSSAPAVQVPTEDVLTIGESRTVIPSLGLCCASSDSLLSATAQERLRSLRLAHLRVDLTLDSDHYPERLTCATEQAKQLGVALEIALFLGEGAETQLPHLLDKLRQLESPVVRWLVFNNPSHNSSEEGVSLVRKMLGEVAPTAKIGGGTDEDFVELNRFPPPIKSLDLVSYSLNPQVHNTDAESLNESLSIQQTTVREVQRLAPGLPVCISPIWLKPRYFLSVRNSSQSCDALPPDVDVRQMSLYGAAWTVGSIKNVAEAGVHSATYYEAVGWKGVMEMDAGSPIPDKFTSIPGAVFPLFHVFADLGEFSGGETLATSSSLPSEFEALTLLKNGRTRMLVTNLGDQARSIKIRGAPSSNHIRCRHLQEDNALDAMKSPEKFRLLSEPQTFKKRGELDIKIAPFGVMTIDFV